ncbi:MAG: PaaI family thioesterase [Candidatus Lokiarchaeota archaeon]
MSGVPEIIKEGYSKIRLKTTDEMVTDDLGLIHGGFIFSLADYAAMLAVNHPNVVLSKANVKFIKPTVFGDELIAEGKIINHEGKRYFVRISIVNKNVKVFEGDFECYVPENHVLEDKK